MAERRPPLLIVPSYVGLAAALERRGCDLIVISRRLTTAGALNKTLALDLDAAKAAAQHVVDTIARFQEGEAAADRVMDKLVNA